MTTTISLGKKIVVVTGGGGIIGTEMVRALEAGGATVVVIEADPKKAKAVSEMPASGAGTIFAHVADIRDKGAIERLAKRIEADVGAVDALINNAAAKSENFFEPFETFPLEDWNHVMGVNLTGAMICSQVFGPRMAERKAGSIVNTLSIYGVVGPDQRIYEGSLYEGRAINTPAVYSASKAGLWGLTKYLATYWGDRNVRVNALTPGGVFSGQNDEFVGRYSNRVPMGRMAMSREIANAAVFLVSDASSYMTGQNLVIDGGLTAW